MIIVTRTELPIVSLGEKPDPEGEGIDPWLDYFVTEIAAKRAAGLATKAQVSVAVDVCLRMMGESAPPWYPGDGPSSLVQCGGDRDFLKVFQDGELPVGSVFVE